MFNFVLESYCIYAHGQRYMISNECDKSMIELLQNQVKQLQPQLQDKDMIIELLQKGKNM